MLTNIFFNSSNNTSSSQNSALTISKHHAIQQGMSNLHSDTSVAPTLMIENEENTTSGATSKVAPRLAVQTLPGVLHGVPLACVTPSSSTQPSSWVANGGPSVPESRSVVKALKRSAATMSVADEEQEEQEIQNESAHITNTPPSKKIKLFAGDQSSADVVTDVLETVVNVVVDRKRKRPSEEEVDEEVDEDDEDDEDDDDYEDEDWHDCNSAPLKRSRVDAGAEPSESLLVSEIVVDHVTKSVLTTPPKTIPQISKKRKLGSLSSTEDEEKANTTEADCVSPSNIQGYEDNSTSRHILGVRSPSYYRALQKALEGRIGKPGFPGKKVRPKESKQLVLD